MTKLFFKQDGHSLKLFLNSPVEKVNAVAGEISLPAGIKLDQIQTANSIVSFWVEAPALADDKIIFSGIIPGGYQGNDGQILSLILQGSPLETRIQGRPLTIQLTNAQVLLHDGLGTRLQVETPAIIFNPTGNVLTLASDTIPPEEFTPLLVSDPGLFAGQYFLVFNTQDKQSGVGYYEVSEGGDGFNKHWKPASSPYLISNQKLDQRIEVKAVDLAGNERIITAFSPPWSSFGYAFGSIIIAVLILCFFIGKKIFRR